MTKVVNISQCDALRSLMREHALDYYWVPGSDQHFNEYVPSCWRRREFLSGFTGSAGDLLVGLEDAWLWTDSRYWLQADAQLAGTGIHVQRLGEADVLSIEETILRLASQPTTRVGVDPHLITIEAQQRLQSGGVTLCLLAQNLVDQVWATRPPMPLSPVREHPQVVAGQSAADKLLQVRQWCRQQGSGFLVVTDLTEIAWLLNCRGQAVPTTPIFLAYVVLGLTEAWVFMHVSQLDADTRLHLSKAGYSVRPYEDFTTVLATLKGSVWLDPRLTSSAVPASLSMEQSRVECVTSPLQLPRARKNSAEQKGMREAHFYDGLAVIRFFAWVSCHWEGLNECSFADKLTAFRQQHDDFTTVSFESICGYAAHGAIVHYQAEPSTAAQIGDDNCVLIDSGGQYRCGGTTDITRVLHFGRPTAQQRSCYTRVLKGHVSISMAVFNAGTTGAQLDSLARQPLQSAGMDYGHGTGHGVGSYLSVHEGPQAISPRNTVVLEPGMILSNEPGVYCEGEFGIRIENVIMVVASDNKSDENEQYCFETLTQVPYARELIDVALLSPREIAWIDEYHERIFDAYSQYLNPNERRWLKQATVPLGVA